MTDSSIRRALRTRLTTALRERDRAGATALRSVLATLENAEAVPVTADRRLEESEHVAGAMTGVAAADAPRRELSPEQERALVAGEVAELRSSAEEYDALGAAEQASDLRGAAALITETVDRPAPGVPSDVQ